MEFGLIFTYALTYGGAVASLFRPYIGLLIYICFAVCNPQAMWHWSVPVGNYSRLVAIALLVGWVLHGCGNWRLGAARGIVIALVGYWIWSAISGLQASDQPRVMNFLEANAKMVLPFLVGITLIDSVAKLRQIAWVIVLSMGFVAYEYNRDYFQGINRFEIGFAGLDNNSLAIALVTCTGLAFFLGLYSRQWWLKVLALALAGLMTHAVLFSNSRGGMFGLVVTAVTTLLLLPKRVIYYLIFAFAIFVGLQMAGPSVRERFMTSFASADVRYGSAESRVVLWGNCIDAMIKRPILGVGPHHFPLIVHEYGWPPGKEAHTLWLQIGAELGFPGLAFLVAFFGLCVVRLVILKWRQARVQDPWLIYLADAVVAALVGFAVSAQFVSLWGLEVPYYIVLVGAGALKLASLPAQEPLEATTKETAEKDSCPDAVATSLLPIGGER